MGLLIFVLTKNDVWSFRRRPAIGVSTSLRVGEVGLAPRKKTQDSAIAYTYMGIKIGTNGSASLVSDQTSIGSPE